MSDKYLEAYYRTRNYKDYLTRKFDALAREIAKETSYHKTAPILDFGCGYGGLVDALYRAGSEEIHGTDISQWAIEEGHRRFPMLKDRLQFYNRDLLRRKSYLLLMLDVLEHMPDYEVESVLGLARQGCVGSLAVRIPVCDKEGEPFVLPVSNNDPTHINCHTSTVWNARLEKAGFEFHDVFTGTTIYNSPGVYAAIYH
jgi:predicted TPR repeat methyltransferase